jgi:hypothetical protein
VSVKSQPTSRRNKWPPSDSKNKMNKKPAWCMWQAEFDSSLFLLMNYRSIGYSGDPALTYTAYPICCDPCCRFLLRHWGLDPRRRPDFLFVTTVRPTSGSTHPPNGHLGPWTASVVKVSGYRSRGPGFNFWRFQSFWEAAGLERGPFSLVKTTEGLLGIKSRGSGIENRD